MPAAPAATWITSPSTAASSRSSPRPRSSSRRARSPNPSRRRSAFHLIQVTDRKEGKLPDFEKNKPYILEAYAAELQRDSRHRGTEDAKIDVKPMPKDLFPSEPPPRRQPPRPPAGTAAPEALIGRPIRRSQVR